jgi:hypothetical protein
MYSIKQITQYGYAYIVPSICVFGIICNILNLTVLLNPRLKESPYTYLTGLATFDILTLLFGLSLTFTRSQSLWFSHSFDLKREYIFSKLEKNFFLPTTNVFSPMSVLITVALTIERFLFIKFPMKATSYCLPEYARRIILILFVFATLFRIPMYQFYDAKLVKDSTNMSISNYSNKTDEYLSINDISTMCQITNNTTFSTCKIKTVVHYETFQEFYFLVSFFVFEIIPFCVLAILNLNLILMVKKSNNESKILQKADVLQHYPQNHHQLLDDYNKHNNNDHTTAGSQQQQQYLLCGSGLNLRRPSTHDRRSFSSCVLNRNPSTAFAKRNRDQVKLTRTLIAVIFIALFSEISSIVTYDKITYFLIGRYYKEYMTNGYLIQKLITISIIFISHSVNFFLYCAFNTRFLNVLGDTYSFIFNLRPGSRNRQPRSIVSSRISAT